MSRNILTVLVIGSLAITGVSFAADETVAVIKYPTSSSKDAIGAKGVTAPESKRVKAKDMTVQEMATDITETLDDTEEIMNFVPGFKKELDSSGKSCYTFKGVKLEKLEKENIEKLYARIHQEKTRINTENITRQLESVQRIQQLNAIAQNAAATRGVANIPRIPPNPPSSVNVPQPPKVPVQPAVPPKR